MMLLRSASTPILNSWISPSKETSPEADPSPPAHCRTRSAGHHPSSSLSIAALSNSSSPAHEPILSSEKMTRALSESDLRNLSLPPVAQRRKPFAQALNRLSSISLEEEGEEGDRGPADSFSSSIDRLFSSSGLDEAIDSSSEGRALVGVAGGVKDDSTCMLMLSNSGFVSGGGGRICGGSGGGGGGGDGGSGSSDSNNHGHESVDAYYQKMIEANPGNGLLLGNYAKYLKEVRA